MFKRLLERVQCNTTLAWLTSAEIQYSALQCKNWSKETCWKWWKMFSQVQRFFFAWSRILLPAVLWPPRIQTLNTRSSPVPRLGLLELFVRKRQSTLWMWPQTGKCVTSIILNTAVNSKCAWTLGVTMTCLEKDHSSRLHPNNLRKMPEHYRITAAAWRESCISFDASLLPCCLLHSSPS